MNQPIEEKWKGSWQWRSDRMGLDKDQHDEIFDFIENLLEQERKRMSEEVKKLYSLDYMKGSPASFINRVLDNVLSIINK